MKILIVQESDWLERGPHQQHHLADRLAVRGHEIRVIDYEILWQERNRGSLFSQRQVFDGVWKIDPGASIKVVRPGILKIPVVNYLSLVVTHYQEIRRQIDEFKPDVIVGFGILNNYLALKLARRSNIPFVYYWIDVLHRLIPLKAAQAFGKRVEQSVLRGSDRVITINEKLRDYVISEGAGQDTEVICAGIDLAKFQPVEQVEALGTRRELGLKDNDRVLFFMGWIYHFSGVKETAIALARSGDSNLKLLVVGEGDAYEDLKAIRDKYGLHDRLILTGKRPYTDIPCLVAAADICILPAYPWEKIMLDIVPIKLYEYMAMQKPVICTRLPGVYREFGDNGGIVYVEKPEDTIHKASELIKGGIIAELGSRSRQSVQKYDWDILTQSFLRVLEEEINKRKNG